MTRLAPRQNRILRAVKARDFMRLEHELELVEFTHGEKIYEAGDAVKFLYFPVTLVASILATDIDGESTSLAIVGNEGVLGFTVACGADHTPYSAMAISGGAAFRLRRELADWEFDQHASLFWLVLKYGEAAAFNYAQTALCNQHHTVQQRLCGWLLDVTGRSGQDDVAMTQASLAAQLGVRREAVSETAGELQACGILRYSRGQVTILDPKGLQDRACSCRNAGKKHWQDASSRLTQSHWHYRMRPNPMTTRRLAEERAKLTLDNLPNSVPEVRKLVEELEVGKHLLELHMAELTESYAEANKLRHRYSDLYDFAPVAYATVDQSGVIRRINLAGAILLKLKRSEIQRHRLMDSIMPDQCEKFSAFLQRLIVAPEHRRLEVELRPNGRDLVTTVLIDGVVDENGNDCQLAITDITERKVLERQLERSNAEARLLRHALDNVGAYVFLKDRDLKYRYVNWAVLDLIGCTEEELLGRGDSCFFPDDLAKHFEEGDRRALNGEQVIDESTLRHADGRKVHTRDAKSPIYDYSNGKTLCGICGISNDISDLKRVESDLRESEARYRALVAASSDVVYRMSPDWSEMRRVSGGALVPDRVSRSRSWVDTYIFPDDQPGVLAAISEAIRNKSMLELEHRILLKDGSEGWTFSRAVPILNAENEISEWIGMASDVTERKKAEAALKDSYRLMELAERTANAGAWERDFTTGRVVWSDNLYRILGRDPKNDRVDSDTWKSIVVPEDIAKTEAVLKEIVTSPDKPIAFSARVRLADGSVHLFDVIGDAEHDGDGRATRANGIAMDVSSRVELESRLELWSQAFEQAELGIAITDIENDTFLAVNPAFAGKRGYTQDELIGKSVSIILPASEWEWIAPRLGDMGKLSHVTMESTHVRKDGTRFPALVDITIVRNPEGKPTKRVAFATDISQLKEQENQLKHYRDNLEQLVVERTHKLQQAKLAAEAANVAKTNFLSNLNHEIRTPLNGIVGMAYLLGESGLASKQMEYLKMLEESAGRLSRTLTSLIRASEIEAGKLKLKVDQVDVVNLAQKVVEPFREKARAKHLDLIVNIEDFPRDLVGDVGALEQAIWQYLNNAINFTKKGEIHFRIFSVGEDAKSVQIRCEVADTGNGFDPIEAPRLFSLFEQGDSSATREVEGLGLGLAITRGLVDLMGGESGVTSVPGSGSRFWFTVRLERDRL